MFNINSGSNFYLKILNERLYKDLASLGNELFKHAGAITSATGKKLDYFN